MKGYTTGRRRSFRLTFLCLIVLVSLQPSQQVQDQPITEDSVSFNNFGVYMIPRGVAYIAADNWHHVFLFVLPVRNTAYVRN